MSPQACPARGIALNPAASQVRIGILGAGKIGATHSSAYAKMPGVKVVGAWDADVQRAQKLAAQHGAQVFERRADLLRAVDVADVCLPTMFHRENVLAAAAAGKPVICEKPLARTVADCDAVIAACAKAKVPLLVGHVVRFFPEYSALRESILKGDIGEPAVVHMRRVVCAPGGPGAWYWDFEKSGGCVFDTAIHDLDWLLWTFGRPQQVYGVGLRDAAKLQDFGLLTLTWANGLIAHLESSWCHDSFSTSFEAAGSDGLIEFDTDDSVPLKVARIGGQGGGGKVIPESPLAKSPYQVELEHFLEVIGGRAKPVVTAEEAREAVALANACLDAVAARQVVVLPRAKRVQRAKTRKQVQLGAEHPA